ncbi:MAG: DUF7657 domain-containing protein, partial [Bryobacteraceae bacterium]
STAPAADDPMLSVAPGSPIRSSTPLASEFRVLSLRLAICALLTGLTGLGLFLARRHLKPWLHSFGVFLDRTALAISDPAFIVFDRFAIGFYLSILLLFLTLTVAGIHGSSISQYQSSWYIDFAGNHIPAAPSAEPILGIPQPIRSDEWAFHTPAILNQVYRNDAFEAQVSTVGPDNAALVANIPVKHFTTIFRPQFWGFFLLPVSYAFALYWQFKAFLLLTGVFSLLLLLTNSSRIAAFGALWYGFSPFTQWTYSWGSLLPEMVGLLCIVLCTVFYMSVGRRPALLIPAAVICVSGAVNFALCAYLPHQIPLVWLGIFLCIWWVAVKWKAIFTPDHALARVGTLCGAWLAVGIVMLLFYWDAKPALTAIANTIYPGQRTVLGGTYPLLALFAHFFLFWEDGTGIPLPHVFANISECSGFLWLAPVTVFSLRRLHGEQVEKKRAYWILAAFAALLLLWLLHPWPEWLGRVTLMNRTGAGGRNLHALGLVNIALVAICLSLRRHEKTEHCPRDRAILAAGVFVIVYLVFLLINISLAGFLDGWQVTIAAMYTTMVFVVFLENRFKLLVATILLPHIAFFAVVNPVGRGLQAIESTSLFRFVHSHPELLRDRWIVYSDTFADSNFFVALGCDVVTGLKFAPDLKALSLFDPTGAYHNVINRSGRLIAQPEYGPAKPRFDLPVMMHVLWKANPLTPAFRDIGVRYAAFRSRPPPEVAAKMKLLGSGPINEFWLYELP